MTTQKVTCQFWDCTHISCGTEPRRRYSIVTVSRDESANLHQQVGGGVAVQPFLNLKATWSWEILPYKYILLTGLSCMQLWQATHDLWPYTSLSFLLSHKPKKEKSSKFWCNFRHRRVQDKCDIVGATAGLIWLWNCMHENKASFTVEVGLIRAGWYFLTLKYTQTAVPLLWLPFTFLQYVRLLHTLQSFGQYILTLSQLGDSLIYLIQHTYKTLVPQQQTFNNMLTSLNLIKPFISINFIQVVSLKQASKWPTAVLMWRVTPPAEENVRDDAFVLIMLCKQF